MSIVTKQHWTIDQIPGFCITLERRSERWKRFQDQYGVRALPRLRRFLAIDGKKIDIVNDSRISLLTKRNIILKTRRSHEQLSTAGGVGCALSHIALWKWMVDNNEEILLVMEDDAVVPADFKDRINQLIQSSPTLKDPTQWDIWLIGAKWDVIEPISGETASGLIRPYAFFLAHCYIITKKYAEKLLADVFPIESHIDMWMSNYATIHKAHMVATPMIRLSQALWPTDIQVKEIGESICDLPTDYVKTHTLVTNTEHKVARVAEAACIIFLGYLVINHLRKVL